MNKGETVTVILQTADRTRKAQLRVPRSMKASDLVRASTGRWHLGFGVDYQIANLTSQTQLHAHDTLSPDKVRDNDVLMIQPFPRHG